MTRRERGSEAAAVRAYLRRHRSTVPRPYVVSFLLGLALALAYVVIQVVLHVTDPVLARDLLRLLALTYVAGREPALFAVYHTSHPVPVAWAAAMSSLDDVATLLLSVPAIWFMVDRLRRFPLVDAYLRSLERALHRRRAALDRWGLLAFAAFLWLPGWGTGPTVSGGMGVLAGLKPARLIAALSVSAVCVNTFWAILLSGPAQAAPRGGWWEWLPLAIIAALVAAALVSAFRHHRRRFLLEYDRPPELVPGHAAALLRRGFQEKDGVLVLDARRLAASGGPSSRHLALSHWAGELLLLPSMDASSAHRLAGLGVTGVRDLALLPPDLVARSASDASSAALAARWHREARELAAAQAATGTAARASAP
jgi:uncharacterized membrane protein